MSSLYEIRDYHTKVYILPECGKLSQAMLMSLISIIFLRH